MGCVSSKADINDVHPNIFEVMNVDELGNRLNPGQLEVTETDLILYQRRKAPITWPLNGLRRYGFEADLFSFESGRRCPTGPGIYAFRCMRAENLFNLVQSHMQVRNSITNDAVQGENASVHTSNPGPTVPPRPLLPRSTRSRMSVRINSIGSGSVSNGPLSPQEATSPSPSIPYVSPSTPVTTTEQSLLQSDFTVRYVNEETINTCIQANDNSLQSKDFSVMSPSDITTTLPAAISIPPECNNFIEEVQGPSYINIEISSVSDPRSPTAVTSNEDIDSGCLNIADSRHLYMNVVPANGAAKLNLPSCSTLNPVVHCDEDTEDYKHCYANLQQSEILPKKQRSKKPQMLLTRVSCSSIPFYPAPLTPPIREVNYAVLDLDGSNDDSGITRPLKETCTSGLAASDTLKKKSNGYAKIDFDKTVALSHSKNQRQGEEGEAPRKMRQGSTFFERLTRHSRHSSSD